MTQCPSLIAPAMSGSDSAQSLSGLAKNRIDRNRCANLLCISVLVSSLCFSLVPSLVHGSVDEQAEEPAPSIILPKDLVLTTHDLHPYGSYRPDGSFRGVAHDLVSCALENMSITLRLKVLPWRRAQLEVKKGLSDGFYAGSQNADRDDYAVRSVVIADQLWQWYLLKNSSWDPTSAEFQLDASVSSFLGANMQRWLIQNDYKVEATPQDTERLLDLLLLGRIDAALANNYVMDNIIQQRGIDAIVRRQVLQSKPLYVYFSRKLNRFFPDFLPLFNSNIEQCKAKRSIAQDHE